MYIDESIDIDIKKFPQVIQDDIKKMEEFYKKDDWFHFDQQQDAMTISAKTYVQNGKMSTQDYRKLTEKYQ